MLGAPLLPADLRAALHDQPKYLKVLELIAEKGVITASQLGALTEIKAIFKVRGLVGQVQLTLQRLRIAVPFTAEDQQDETVYRWKIRS